MVLVGSRAEDQGSEVHCSTVVWWSDSRNSLFTSLKTSGHFYMAVFICLCGNNNYPLTCTSQELCKSILPTGIIYSF